jgi:hypothetical protein
MLDRPIFPDFVLCLKQGEQDPDAGFLCGELFHDLHPPLDLLEAPFNGKWGRCKLINLIMMIM